MRDNNPWFVAADVCRALEIKNPSDALTKLDEDEKMTLDSTEGHPANVVALRASISSTKIL